MLLTRVPALYSCRNKVVIKVLYQGPYRPSSRSSRSFIKVLTVLQPGPYGPWVPLTHLSLPTHSVRVGALFGNSWTITFRAADANSTSPLSLALDPAAPTYVQLTSEQLQFASPSITGSFDLAMPGDCASSVRIHLNDTSATVAAQVALLPGVAGACTVGAVVCAYESLRVGVLGWGSWQGSAAPGSLVL